MTKLLVAASEAPATPDYTKDELQKHANWLISVLSWIPDDKDTVNFIENFAFTEILFEAALDALSSESHEIAASTRNLLISWAFKGGQHETGWAILEKSLLALATLVLWKEELGLVPWLKAEVTKRLVGKDVPSAARDLRRQAATMNRREFELSRIKHALDQIDPAKSRHRTNLPIRAELDHLAVRVEPLAVPAHDRANGEGIRRS
jgi:hypothetical protein